MLQISPAYDAGPRNFLAAFVLCLAGERFPLAMFGDFTVTKADLIDSLAQEVELSKRQAGEIVDHILDEIRNSLVKGDKVQLIPFGSFVVRERAKREGRNPKTGAKLMIPARRVPAFTAGKGLRDAVAGPKKKSAEKKTSAKKK